MTRNEPRRPTVEHVNRQGARDARGPEKQSGDVRLIPLRSLALASLAPWRSISSRKESRRP